MVPAKLRTSEDTHTHAYVVPTVNWGLGWGICAGLAEWAGLGADALGSQGAYLLQAGEGGYPLLSSLTLGSARAHSGTARAHFGAARAHSGAARAHSGAARAYFGVVRSQCGTAQAHSGAARAHFVAARAHFGAAQAHFGAACAVSLLSDR